MSLLRAWPILWGALAFLCGTIVGTLVQGPVALVAVGLLTVSSVLGLCLLVVRRSTWLVVPLLGVVSAGGVGLVAVHTARLGPALASEQTVSESVGTIVSAPESLGERQRAYLELPHEDRTVRVRATWPTTGEDVRYGQVVIVSGTLLPPRVLDDFNERGFLRAHQSVGRFEATSLAFTGARSGSRILRWLHNLRSVALARLNHALSPPESAIVAGVVLGDQATLPTALEEAFRRTGTTHILVVSGSNVLVLAVILRFLAQPLVGRTWSLGLTALVLLAFVVISGADASVIRAATVYGFVMAAVLLGRRVHVPTLVALVAALMVAHNPWLLLSDIGFQLSFAAVVGLVWLVPWLFNLLPVWSLREYLAPTLAAQLLTLPILLFHFGAVSLVAPLANVLVGPIVPAVQYAGLAVVLLPWFRLLAWATEGATTLILWIVTTLGAWPSALSELPAHHLGWTLASLGLIGLVGWLKQWSERRHEPSDLVVAYGD